MSDGGTASVLNVWKEADDTGALERYRALARMIDHGILQLDAESRVVAVDDSFLDRTGYPRDAILGEHVSHVLGRDDSKELGREISRQIEDGTRSSDPLELRVRTAAGVEVDREFRVNPIVDDGEFRGAVCIVRDVDEREHDEDGAEHERQLSTLLENLPGMVYRCRNERGWPMEFVSEGCRGLTGYDPGALMRGDLSYGEDVIVDEDREALWEDIQRGLDEDGSFLVTYRIETPDGDVRWVRERGHGVYDGGELEALEGVIIDVTERRRAEQRLAEERDMFADGPAVVFRWVPDPEAGWPVEYVSENVVDVLGYTPEEFESGEVPYADLLLDEEIDRIASEVERNSDGTTERFSHEPYRVETRDGEIRWVKDTTKIIRDDSGEITNYLGYLVDITERKERERELEQYETIVETVNDGVYVVDDDGRFTMVNDAYAEMTGYDRGDLLGEHASLVVGEEVVERAAEVAATMRRDATEAPTVEAELQTADGERLPAEARFALLSGPDGEERRVGVVRDVSDRRERERKLRESNERLEQFAYAASHDLQEPLRMVSSYLQLIERRYADALDDDGEEFLEFAVDGADRMREMIEGLLQYSRVESGGDPLEPVELEALLADVLADLQVKVEESEADLTVGDLPRVSGDPSQLRQVFQNLIENAIEYSGEEPPRIEVDAERDGGQWVVSVRDQGVGIDPDDQERVFEVFERLEGREDHAGTGIGLALCERIVERHGGDIWVESKPGEGSTFSFTLPAAQARREAPEDAGT